MRENINSLYEPREERKKIVVTFADIKDGVEARAQEMADARMSADKDELSGVRGFFKRVWRHNLAYDYFRRKALNEAKEKISAEGNLFADQGDDKAFSDEARTMLAERLSSEYEEARHAGEEAEAIGSNEEDESFKKALNELLKSYVRGEIDDDALLEEKNRLFSGYASSAWKEKGDVKVNYADNVLVLAKELKQSLDHGEGLKRLDDDFEIRLGKGRLGVRTEARYGLVDKTTKKIMDLAGKIKVDAFINEASLGLAVAGAYCLTAGLAKKVSMSKLGAYGTFGVTAAAGAGIAAARESRILENERKQHAREMAQGSEIKPGSVRREKMESYRYETVSCASLLKGVEAAAQDEISQDNLDAMLGALADIEARIKLSDQENIDLVSYSHIKNVEKERFALDVARAKAKVNLRKRAADGTIALPAGKDFDGFLELLAETKAAGLSKDEIGKKNKEFSKYKRKEVLIKAGKTLAYGIAAGALVNEVFAFAKDSQQGLVEGLFKGQVDKVTEHVNYTPLENLRRFFSDDFPRMDDSMLADNVINGGNIKLPAGVELVSNSAGTYDLMRSGEVFCPDLEIDADGQLTDASKGLLADKGVFVTESVKHIEHMVPGKVAPKGFVDNHDELFKKIKRTLWYDNDTPKPVFDKNELKTDWGGERGTGIDKAGNFVMNVKRMMADGSYHDKFSTDALSKAGDGKLKLLLSLSADTQSRIIEVPIGANGDILIDKDSDVGKLLFDINADGHAVFKGKFAEVAEMMGAENGVEKVRILSTVVGKGTDFPDDDDLIPDPVPVVSDVSETILDVPGDHDVDPPFFIPITGRRPLERVIKDKTRIDSFGGYNDSRRKNIDIWRKERSPRLLDNPKADLDQENELKWYFDEQAKKEGKDYIDEIDSFVDSDKHLNAFSKATKIIVCMPVAGHAEMDNIYKTLEIYSKQDASSLEQTQILLNVNFPEDAKMADVEKTISEIERAKKEFPNLKISSFQKIWKRSWIESKDKKIYGTVVKYLNDTALRTIQRSGIKNDVFLLTNDADCRGMSNTYLKNLLNSVAKDKNIDGYLGKLEWGSEMFDKYPGFHVTMRFLQYIEAVSRRPEGQQKNIASSGANFMCKASTFAAVGGYDARMGAGADTDLGKRIKAARSGDKFLFKNSEYPIKYVNASWIDTDPGRGIDYYKKGKPIIDMWNDYDTGGYKPRGDIKEYKNDSEDITGDFDSIISRVEYQLNYTILSWIGFDQKKVYSKALNYLLPKTNGKKTWKLISDKDGNKAIKITDEGKGWLKQQLASYSEENKKNVLYRRRGLRRSQGLADEPESRTFSQEQSRSGEIDDIAAEEAPVLSPSLESEPEQAPEPEQDTGPEPDNHVASAPAPENLPVVEESADGEIKRVYKEYLAKQDSYQFGARAAVVNNLAAADKGALSKNDEKDALTLIDLQKRFGAKELEKTVDGIHESFLKSVAEFKAVTAVKNTHPYSLGKSWVYKEIVQRYPKSEKGRKNIVDLGAFVNEKAKEEIMYRQIGFEVANNNLLLKSKNPLNQFIFQDSFKKRYLIDDKKDEITALLSDDRILIAKNRDKLVKLGRLILKR